MTLRTAFLSTLCAAALGTGAIAQEKTPVDPATLDLGQRIAMSYSDMAAERFTDLLEPEQALRLLVLTKQRVVGAVCEGYVLDEAKMNEVQTAILNTQPMIDGTFSPLILGRIMQGYGIFLGGEMALATYDPDAYCGYGKEIIKELSGDAEGEKFLVLSTSN
jgi:hypothetical protein